MLRAQQRCSAIGASRWVLRNFRKEVQSEGLQTIVQYFLQDRRFDEARAVGPFFQEIDKDFDNDKFLADIQEAERASRYYLRLIK